MEKSKIKWTSWNPITGCNKISSGCLNCYAYGISIGLKRNGNPKYKNGFNVTLHENFLNEPYSWKKPKSIFVNSMSDFLHKDVSIEFLEKLFKVMNENPIHTFQLLTKRPERFLEIKNIVNFTPNIWLGVTCENEKYKYRIDLLRDMPAHRKFICLEPLLGDLGKLDLTNIDWVIAGGESGANARPMLEEWVINILNQCKEWNKMFYFKQWGDGGSNKNKSKKLLGEIWNEMPELLSNKFIKDIPNQISLNDII